MVPPDASPLANPSFMLHAGDSRQNTPYKYPDIYVCPRELFGCDREDLEQSCSASYNQTDGGITEAMFTQRGKSTQEIAVEIIYTETVSPCLTPKG